MTNRVEQGVLVPLDQYDVKPSYYIWGGLVFCPLTTDLLKICGANWRNDAPKDLVSMLDRNYTDDRIDEVVLLTRVLAADLNRGYQDMATKVVKTVNGKQIHNLKELVKIVETAQTPFVSFEDQLGTRIVMDRARVQKEQGDILKTYGVLGDRSADLLLPQSAPKVAKQ